MLNDILNSMKEQYSMDEILSAVKELNEFKINKVKKSLKENKNKLGEGIPSNTLKLIEEAEKTIKSKLQSE